MRATITTNFHGMPSISITTDEETATKLRGVATNCFMDSVDYKLGRAAGAFLQCFNLCGDQSYVLIELWSGTTAEHEAFLTHINNVLSE